MTFSTLALIVLILVVVCPGIPVFFLVVGGKRDQGERSWSLLGRLLAVGLALFVGVAVLFLFFRVTSHQRAPVVSIPPIPVLVVLSHESDAAPPVVTNEQLWNLITESRIDLGKEPEEVPPEESKPNARPGWVDEPPKRVGDVYRAVVASDPFSTADECFEQLEQLFPVEVERRLAKLVPRDQRSHVESASLEASGVTLDYIMREICREQFTETTEHDFGAMKKVYVLMEFTPAIESHLLDSWQTYLRRYRLTAVAQIAGCVLATLAFLYGLLQIDTWTRGYYTRWLLWGVPAAILALFAILALLNVA